MKIGPFFTLCCTAAILSCGGSGGLKPSPDGGGDDGSSGGSDAPFTMATHADSLFHLTVSADGKPLRDAIVIVGDPTYLPAEGSGQFREDLTTGRVYFRGRTDWKGQVSDDLRLLANLEQCDVVVNHRDYVGDFTEEQLRADAGPFAPSARLRVDTSELSNLEITLQAKP